MPRQACTVEQIIIKLRDVELLVGMARQSPKRYGKAISQSKPSIGGVNSTTK